MLKKNLHAGKKENVTNTNFIILLPAPREASARQQLLQSFISHMHRDTKKSNCQIQEAVQGLVLEDSSRLNIFLN